MGFNHWSIFDSGYEANSEYNAEIFLDVGFLQF